MSDTGHGRALLLLHGAPGAPERLPALTHRLTKPRRVLVARMPGYAAEPFRPAESVEQQSAWLEDALLERGVRELDVCGFSFGAYRALLLALSARVRVNRVLLLGGFAWLPAEVQAEYLQFRQMIATLPDLKAPDLRRMFLERSVARARWDDPAVAEEVGAAFSCVEPQALAADLTFMSRCNDLRSELRRSNVEVVARVGALDQVTPTTRSEEIAASVPGARLEVVAGCGHFLPVEDARGAAESLARLLES